MIVITQKSVVEFILPLCLLIVSAFRPICHGCKVYKVTGYGTNNAIITTHGGGFGFPSDLKRYWDGVSIHLVTTKMQAPFLTHLPERKETAQ